MRAEWPGGNSVRTMVGLTDGQVAQYREQGWVAPVDVLYESAEVRRRL